MYIFSNSRMKYASYKLEECIKYAFFNTCYLDDHTKIYEEDNGSEKLLGFIANDGTKLRYFEWSDEYVIEDYIK